MAIKTHWEAEYAPTAVTGTYAATYATDASKLGTRAVVNITATGDMTLSAPTGGKDGQRIKYFITASGGARTVTLGTGIKSPALLPASPGTPGSIASGKVRLLELIWNGTFWFCSQDREEA